MQWLTIDHISSEIALIENFWVVLQTTDGEDVNADEGALVNVHYDLWSRCAPSKMSVGHWRRRRMSRVLPGLTALVVRDDGTEVEDHCTLATLRAQPTPSYQPRAWPNSRPIFFRYDCPEPDVAYRLNEELRAAGYSTNAKIEKGWFSKSNLVTGGIGETRVFPWEFEAWKDEMDQRGHKFSSELSVSITSSLW